MKKNKSAQNIGRLGGLATAKKLTKKQRIASAKRAASMRWAKFKREEVVI